MVFTMIPGLEQAKVYGATYNLSNPRVTSEKTTWDCVYFGSYPQREVVSKKTQCGTYGMDWGRDGDYIINSNLYNELKNSSNWNSKNVCTIDGIKYKRIKKEDSEFYVAGETQYKWSDSTTYHYFKYEKIKWRVLSVSDGKAFLLADKGLDSKAFNNGFNGGTSSTWETCTLRSWLNDDFLNAFSSSETNSICKVNIDNPDNASYETEGGNSTTDKVFILSEAEAYDDANGFGNFFKRKTLAARTSTYAKAMGAVTGSGMLNYEKRRNVYCDWWLRTPGRDQLNFAFVSNYGDIVTFGDTASLGCYAIRPSIMLDLLSNTWSNAGTTSSTFQWEEPQTYKNVEAVTVGVDENTSEISLFEDAKGSIGDKPITKVFPNDFSLKFPASKFKMKKESNDDGTYKFKVEIGLKENAAIGSDKAFKKFKKDFKNAKDNINDIKKLKTLIATYGAKSGALTITKGFKPTWDALGYYEATISETGAIIKEEGGIIVSAKGEYTYTQQCILAPIPVPFYVEIGGKVETKAKAAIKNLISNPEITGTLSINPSLFAGVGAGVCELATLGVRGTGGLKMQVLPTSKGDFTADLSIQYKLIFVFEGEYTLAKATYPLWPKKKSSLMSQAEQVSSLSNLKFANWDYQKNTTSWNGGRNNVLWLSNSSESLSNSTLQEYILPDSIPKINKLSDKKVMIFQANEATRTSANATVLKYSILKNGNWSDPEPVKDNGTLDTYADSKVIGNNLYVAWQKCDSVIESTNVDTAINDAAANSEIYVAKFNSSTNRFEDVWQVTDNEYLDGMPKLVDCDGKLGVVWMRNENNSLMNASGTKKIYSSTYNGDSWSSENKLSEATGTIIELTGIYQGNKLTAYYTVSNSDGTEQYLCRNNGDTSKVLQTNTENAISNLKVFDNKLNYVEEGNLKILSNSDDAVTAVDTVESNRIGSNAIRQIAGSKDAILWMSNDDNGCAFYSSINDDGEYSSPVEIYRDKNNTGKMFDAVLNEDGSWDIVYTGQSMSDGLKTSMFYVNKQEEEKVALNDVLINEYELSAGSQPIQYSVTNNGEKKITQLNLSINAESAVANGPTNLVDKTINCSIAPGETAYFEDKFESKKSETIQVQVSAKNQKDMTDTEFSEDVEYNNFSVDVEKSVSDDSVSFVATVQNTGTESHDGTVAFYKDSNAKDLLETKSFDTLAPGQSETIKFVYSTDEAVINAEDACPCSIKVDAGKEFDETDNIWCGITYLWEFPYDTQDDMHDNCHIHNLEKTNAKNATCLVTGNIEYWTCDGCNKIFVDECGNGIIEAKDTVLSKLEHSLTHVYATEATDTTDGNYEYWYCGECNKYFKNENATEEYTGNSWIIPKTGGGSDDGGGGSGGGEEPQDETFTVSFDLQGHGTPIDNMEVKKDSVISLQNEPTENGYLFAGWFKDKNCNFPWLMSSDKVKSNMTLYAKWIKVDVKKTAIKSLKAGKRSFTVKVKRLSKSDCDGYRVRYSLKKNMSGAKKANISTKYNVVSKKITKLKPKKTYYVQVRTIKNINGKNYYSDWSKIKKIRITR